MVQRVVVIGSNSFSGSDFIDLLLEDQNYEVVGISRSPEKKAMFLPYLRHKSARFQFHQFDLNKDLFSVLTLLDSVQPDYIVNFAAQSEVAPSWDHPGQWFQTNVAALSELCNHIKKTAYLKRYVHISSPEVYGTCNGRIKEDAPLNPSTPYAASKAAGDLFLFTLVKNYNFPLTMIRSTNVYGAHQQLFKIIPRSVINIKMGRTIPLHGGGQSIKSYIHIRDISRGELAVMERGRVGEIYHLSPDQGVSVRDLVRLIAESMGAVFENATRDVNERLGQDAAYVIDSSKAREEFGWLPQIGLQQGISEVIHWINQHWKEMQKESLEYIHKP